MRELGHVDGRNYRLEVRWSDGQLDRLPALARESLQLKPDVAITAPVLSAQALNSEAKQEADADLLVGLEPTARAGGDPRAAVSVRQRMSRLSQSSAQGAGRGQAPQFLSTHPSNESRIKEIEANLPEVLPLCKKAP